MGALDGMAALITGGAGGIGGASARWLLRDGCSVTLMGRTESSLQEQAAELEADRPAGTSVQYHAGDAHSVDDFRAALDLATKPTGGLNITVATVGGGTMVPFLAMSEETFTADLLKNALTSFIAVKYSAPIMAAGGGGSIVLISSDVARMPWPFLNAYCAGKSALEGMMETAADELGPLNVRVNAVRPGLVKTNANTRLFDNAATLKQFTDEKPLGRTGVPDDIAAGVRYLAGPESSWVTGQSFAIEGGNELRKAPYLEGTVRARYGDEVVDACLAGKLPDQFF
jgi:NAD(P)-dependent dehydrogenase (short-subunit alcohol dehydrogenase family)